MVAFVEEDSNEEERLRTIEKIKESVEGLSRVETLGFFLGLSFFGLLFTSLFFGFWFLTFYVSAIAWNNSIALLFSLPLITWKNSAAFFGIFFIFVKFVKYLKK